MTLENKHARKCHIFTLNCDIYLVTQDIRWGIYLLTKVLLCQMSEKNTLPQEVDGGDGTNLNVCKRLSTFIIK